MDFIQGQMAAVGGVIISPVGIFFNFQPSGVGFSGSRHIVFIDYAFAQIKINSGAGDASDSPNQSKALPGSEPVKTACFTLAQSREVTGNYNNFAFAQLCVMVVRFPFTGQREYLV